MKKLYLIINDNPEEDGFITSVSTIVKNILNQLNSKGTVLLNGTKLNSATSELILRTLSNSKSTNIRYLPTPAPNIVLGELEVFFGDTLKKLKKVQDLLIKELEISQSTVPEFKDKFSQLFERVVNIVPDYSSMEELIEEIKDIPTTDAVLITGKCPNEFRKEIEDKYPNINCFCISDSAEKDTTNKLIEFLNDTKSMG